MITKQEIFNMISAERLRQDMKWGEQNHNPIEWMAVLTEEVGESAQDALKYYFSRGGNLTEKHLLQFEAEIIQVAAVAVAIIESLYRNELKQR